MTPHTTFAGMVATAAERAKDAADNAATKRASETGRWPRVIGGG